MAWANLPGKIAPFPRAIFPNYSCFGQMKRIFILRDMLKKFLVICTVLTGCASTTGIVPTGKDTFMISREDNSPAASLGTIKAATFKEAGAHCAAQSKNLKVVSESDTPRSLGQFPQTTLQFTCV